MLKTTQIVISYFTANQRKWVATYYTPYKKEYVKEIRTIPTAHYDIVEKYWCCEAKYGERVEALVKKHFPDIPLDIQDHDAVRLNQFAEKQSNIKHGGWSDKTIETFILKWSKQYNGQYADDEVSYALRANLIDPNWLHDVAKAVAEKHGGTPIYT